MSKYRIKRVTDSCGTESFTAQSRFLGLWFDFSPELTCFDVVNSYVERAVYRESLRGGKKKVDFLEPYLSRPIS